MKLKLNIIGCGRLGKTLAFLLARTQRVMIQDVVNLSLASAEEAVSFIGQGTACYTIGQLRPADIYLIATPDDCVPLVGQQLAERASFETGRVVFHCSGFLSSSSLEMLTQRGAHTASVHPVFSFSDPVVDVQHFSGTHCLFEGSEQAFKCLLVLIESIEGQLSVLKKQDKALYHTASVFAANYLVTLFAIARDCYRKAGISDELAGTLTQTLMEQVLHRLRRSGEPSLALTGPIQRGESHTIKGHLRALSSLSDLQLIYKGLGKATLPLTTHKAELRKIMELLFQ